MKYLKKYEDVNKPEVGDYVYCQEDLLTSDDETYYKAMEFVKNNIGKILKKNPKYSDFFVVRYENIPFELKEYFNVFKSSRNIKYDEIIYWGKTKEEVEAKINSEKYNL